MSNFISNLGKMVGLNEIGFEIKLKNNFLGLGISNFSIIESYFQLSLT